MSRRDADVRHTVNNRITNAPGMVNSLGEAQQHSVNADGRFSLEHGVEIVRQSLYNGFDKIENEHSMTQLDSEESALAALRAFAAPGVTFDIDKLIVAAAAFKFHKDK